MRLRTRRGDDQHTFAVLASENLPSFCRCLNSSPLMLYSNTRKIRLESWKYVKRRRIFGCLVMFATCFSSDHSFVRLYHSPEVLLDLNFPSHLLLHLVLFDLVLHQAFNGTDKMRRCSRPSEVDSSKLASTEFPADLE